MAVRSCTVSFKDGRGVEHSTEVLAETVMEAAALRLRFREERMIDDDGVCDLRVEVTTRTAHVVPLLKLKSWLESGSVVLSVRTWPSAEPSTVKPTISAQLNRPMR